MSCEIKIKAMYNNYERVAESVNPVTCHAFFCEIEIVIEEDRLWKQKVIHF